MFLQNCLRLPGYLKISNFRYPVLEISECLWKNFTGDSGGFRTHDLLLTSADVFTFIWWFIFFNSPFVSDGHCDDCHDNCLTCTGPSDTDCQTCDYDRFLNLNNQCEEECVAGYYPNYVSNLCEPCHASCLTCVQGGAEDCMDCSDST